MLIALNFTEKEALFNTSINTTNAKVMLSNYNKTSFDNTLQPFEAIILEINN
jgi:hypothetical protein